MANTKIINLKRYSKKRVPKKVLKGGGRRGRDPQERDRGQKGRPVARVSLSPRSTGQKGWPENRYGDGSRSDSDDESTASRISSSSTVSRASHSTMGSSRPGSRQRRNRSRSDSGSSNGSRPGSAWSDDDSVSSYGSRPGSAPLTPRKKKIKYLRKKIKEEGIDFLRLNAAWSSKPSFSSQDDFILHTWGDLFDNDGRPIKEFDEKFKAIAKVEVPRRPPSSARSRSTTPEPRHVRGDSPTRGRQLVRKEEVANDKFPDTASSRPSSASSVALSDDISVYSNRTPSPRGSNRTSRSRGSRKAAWTEGKKEGRYKEREIRERKLNFLKEALGKLKKYNYPAYQKYEAGIKKTEDPDDYILDIWGDSYLFRISTGKPRYSVGDSLPELVKIVNRRFSDRRLNFQERQEAASRAHVRRQSGEARKQSAAKAAAQREDVMREALERSAAKEAERREARERAAAEAEAERVAATEAEAARQTIDDARKAEADDKLELAIKALEINFEAEITHRTKFNDALEKRNEAIKIKENTTEENTIINNLAEQNRDKIRKIFIVKGCLPGKNDITAVEESLITILNVEQPFQNIKKKLEKYQNLENNKDFGFPSTLTEMLVNERLLSNKISNNSKNNVEYMQYLGQWDAANWELNKKKYEINTPPKQKLEENLKNSIEDSIKDWINIDTNEEDMFSISIKLNDDLKVPYPYFLDKMKELNSGEYKSVVHLENNTKKIFDFIGLEKPFSFIKNDLKDRLHKFYDVEYRAGENYGGATRGGASTTITTPEDFIMLMAKWCFIIWGYKTLNKNFCNKYLENKKPSSYTKEQLSLDYRRKITGITRIYARDDILMKNQFVIKASLNKAHIPDYKKEINNYEKLWENNKNDDNKFKVLKYFGSSEKWHKENIDNNKGYKGYSSSPPPGDADNQKWKENNLVWEYDNQSNVLTIINKINGKHSLKISTNLDKHAEAIKNNGEKTTSNVCWFAIEWDPDFIPFSTSHSGGERDLKLDQTVLGNMKENIYHLSEQYGFYHGDLHTENFLYNIKGDIRRFDFDFSGIIKKDNNNINNDQINIYFGWQPSKISMFLFFNLYKNKTWDDSHDNIKWNPTASGNQAYPKHQHLEFLRLFDTHRMLLHYFLSTKGPYNTNVNDIKDVIENIFTEKGEEEERHKKILIESVTNNMYTFWNGSATKKEFEKRLDSDMVYENTWNAGCMYSLLWYFGKHKKDPESDAESDADSDAGNWGKWYDYDNHLKFFEIHLKNLLKKMEASNV